MSKDAYVFDQHFSDGSVDHTNPHRPGFRFLDIGDVAKLAADEANEQRRERIHYSNRQRQQDAAIHQRVPARTLDALQQDAEVAYAERNKRLQNAWRHKDGA
jgi:hypothetical protein